MNEFLQVFVYGSLKPGEIHYPRYCQGKTIREIKVYTFGQLYYLKALGYPAMTPGTDKVHGYLLGFSDPAHLEKIDQLEDYDAGRAQKENEYQRELVEVYLSWDQAPEKAWAYLMKPEKIQLYQGVVIKSGWFSGESSR